MSSYTESAVEKFRKCDALLSTLPMVPCDAPAYYEVVERAKLAYCLAHWEMAVIFLHIPSDKWEKVGL